MRIFGTVFPFIESREDDFRLGRHVANFEFFKALLTYSTFDEYHLFCLSVPHREITRKKIDQLNLPQARRQSVRLFLVTDLLVQIRKSCYVVFHLGGWGYFFSGLVYLRNRHALNLFPITGLIHSLNGLETPYHALKVSLAPLRPYDTIVCSSHAGKEVVEKVLRSITNGIPGMEKPFGGSLAVVPLGVDDDILVPIDKRAIRAELGIADQAVVLLTVGRFTPSTKMDLYPLLLVLKHLRQANPQREIIQILAGGGSESQLRLVRTIAAELGIAEWVRIIPDFSTRQKPLLYGAADIFVSPSDNLQETFGISIIEAMAFGLPVVAADINGYKELVVEGETGFRIPAVWAESLDLAELSDIMNFETMQLLLAQCMAIDTGAMTTALQRLISDQPLRQAMGVRARALVNGKYRWSILIGEYEKMWAGLFEQSQTIQERAAALDNPLMNKYFQTFSHYPTRVMTDTMTASITEEGRVALQNGMLPAAYDDMSPFIDGDRILDLLSSVSAGECSIKTLKEKVLPDPERAETTMLLLWMAKYGLIRLG